MECFHRLVGGWWQHRDQAWCLDSQSNAISTSFLRPLDTHICLYPLPLNQAGLTPALEGPVCQESQKQIAGVFRLWIPQSVPLSR